MCVKIIETLWDCFFNQLPLDKFLKLNKVLGKGVKKNFDRNEKYP